MYNQKQISGQFPQFILSTLQQLKFYFYLIDLSKCIFPVFMMFYLYLHPKIWGDEINFDQVSTSIEYIILVEFMSWQKGRVGCRPRTSKLGSVQTKPLLDNMALWIPVIEHFTKSDWLWKRMQNIDELHCKHNDTKMQCKIVCYSINYNWNAPAVIS